MNDSTNLEQTLRDTLHDAADHAPLASPTPLASTPTRASSARTHSRSRALVAACVVALGVAVTVGAVVATRDDDAGVQVATPAGGSREVPLADIPRSDADIEAFMVVQATDADIQGVRDFLETSPDVASYSYVDHQAQYREFSEVFSCNADLVHSIRPEDLPASFRVMASSPEAVDGLRSTLEAVPGVQAAEVPADPSSTLRTVCSDTSSGGEVVEAEPFQPAPTTVPPTLPSAGDPPADPSSARDGVVAAFTQAWDGSSTVQQRRAAMQGSDQLADALDRARAGNEATITSMRAVIGDVAFVAPDRAAVVFHLEFSNGLVQPTLVGDAVLEDGTWKVSRETVCAVLSGAAGVSCPAG